MYIILRSGGHFKLMVRSTMNKVSEMYEVHISESLFHLSVYHSVLLTILILSS